MRRLLSISAFLILSAYTAFAQSSFIEHIESEREGRGTVRILQDPKLTAIINGDFIPTEEAKKKNSQENSVGSSKKIKKRGYRIQAYKGGHTRAAETAAKNMGDKIQQQFELDVYVIYNNPEWVCRVGDFKTRDEALEYLQKIKRFSPSAMIVPSEIFIKDN